VVRVAPDDLRIFVFNIFRKIPLNKEHAKLISELLVDTDLRGVFTHGVSKVERYVSSFLNGKANTHPNITILRDGPVTAVLNGDGGIGSRYNYISRSHRQCW
jgi:LDH2 family malate/lactate/ureidoglycolate dehydrogenase